MRCGLVVDEKEVLAVVLGDIEGSLLAEIKRTLTGTDITFLSYSNDCTNHA